ncbi:ABC transporter permease [Bacillus massilinigeriensis]|uniref:ABC transporter permease n=1 Tax=Bacillus massilionigeriensis TaxID=1805475 RepID=UPI00096B093B|nr:ABC transporter permease [Bacillus massilionigeriensis]
MSFISTVIKEQIQNFYLIRRLSLYEVKTSNNNNYLGMLWEILNPGIQIAIYWFVFGYVSNRDNVDGIEYFPWMLAGITLWFFVNPAITQGSKSIYTRLKMLSKMNFPMSVIPSYVIFSKLYPHMMLIVVITLLLQFLGYPISIYYIQLPYFLFATVVFLFALSLITSTLTTIVRDFQNVVTSIMRVLLYLTPILWASSRLPDWMQMVMLSNPLYYLIQGYRASMLGTGWFFVDHWLYTLYFWGILLVLLFIGSMLHVKFRRHFIDYL